MKNLNDKLLKIALVFLLIFIFSTLTTEAQQKTSGLPEMMTWSAYDIGSRGYGQAAAISNALTKKFRVKIRILPSGTSVGRMMPLKTGAATYGLLADEASFALLGIYEFAHYNWGPQDLRVVLAKPAPVGMVATAKSGIKTPKDFKGKRIVWVPGASTLNVKAEAFLAFAGLTWKDVQKVEFPSHAASHKGLIEGKVDSGIAGITAPSMYELEASPQGIIWPEFPASDKEGWARVQKIAPWLFPGKYDIGPGFKKGEPKEIPFYRYPQLVTYAKQNPEEVYFLVKAIDETFDMYKAADPEMPDWVISESGTPPAGAPFHEGAVRYLKEKRIWKVEYDQWNRQIIERVQKLQQLWEKTFDEATAKGVSEKNFPDYWMEKRKEIGE